METACDEPALSRARGVARPERQNRYNQMVVMMVNESLTGIAALLSERTSPAEQVWAAAERRLDKPLSDGLNTAHEACERWAGDSSRLAIIVRSPDGASKRWTFADLAHASSRLATAWRAAGIKRGDRVAAVLGQQIEAYICALAAWRSGIIYMPLFTGFASEALAQRINGADVSAVIVDHQHRTTLEQARALLAGDPPVYTVADAGAHGVWPGDRNLWDEIDKHAADTEIIVTSPHDPATLIYTSGTTGAPKGVVMPHAVVLALQPFVRHVYALAPSDLLFSGASPGWGYGLYTTGFAVMALGIPRVIYTGSFDTEAWLRVIDEEKATYMTAAPSAYRRLVQSARESGSAVSVRGASSAGEPQDVPLARAWHELTGVSMQDSYGQTESGMVLADLAFDDRRDVEPRPGAISSTVPGFEIGLVDADGHVQDDEGIIAVRRSPYHSSIGFWNAQDLWERRWQNDWFLTGDRARRDDDGQWRFVGRDDDLIVTSGYNVGPTEVESIVLEHPGVADGAVVAAPDPKRGSVVRAVLVATGTVSEDQITAEVTDWVRTRLGRHAAPKIVDFVDEMPRTETGKIRRNVLREQIVTGSD